MGPANVCDGRYCTLDIMCANNQEICTFHWSQLLGVPISAFHVVYLHSVRTTTPRRPELKFRHTKQTPWDLINVHPFSLGTSPWKPRYPCAISSRSLVYALGRLPRSYTLHGSSWVCSCLSRNCLLTWGIDVAPARQLFDVLPVSLVGMPHSLVMLSWRK